MFRQIIALTIKDLKIIFKDPGDVATLFLMPAMFIIIMSNARAGSFGCGNDQLINVLVVNLDHRAALKDNPGFTGNQQSSMVIKETQPNSMPIGQYPNTVQQNVPGWALFGVFFISGILAQNVLEEKRTGAFRRLVASPLSRATVLLGKLVPHVIVNLIQITIFFLVGYFVLPLTGLPRLEWGAHPEGLIIISVCVSLTANALGLMLAAVVKSEQQLRSLSTLLVLTLAAIGGVMVPRFVMPQFMQTLGIISPHAWAMNGYQDILVCGYGLIEILPECAVLLAMALAMFSMAAWKFKWE